MGSYLAYLLDLRTILFNLKLGLSVFINTFNGYMPNLPFLLDILLTSTLSWTSFSD